jgi:hypothetical protein
MTSSINAVNEALRLYVEAATAWARLEALRDTESSRAPEPGGRPGQA